MSNIDNGGVPATMPIPPSPPTAGQVYTAVDPVTASWQTPSSSVPNQQFASVHVGVIASATPSSIITVTLGTPYADQNFQVLGSVVSAETPGDGAATAICCIGNIQILTNQTFCFVVCNADGVSHDVTANFATYHS